MDTFSIMCSVMQVCVHVCSVHVCVHVCSVHVCVHVCSVHVCVHVCSVIRHSIHSFNVVKHFAHLPENFDLCACAGRVCNIFVHVAKWPERRQRRDEPDAADAIKGVNWCVSRASTDALSEIKSSTICRKHTISPLWLLWSLGKNTCAYSEVDVLCASWVYSICHVSALLLLWSLVMNRGTWCQATLHVCLFHESTAAVRYQHCCRYDCQS